MKLTPSRVLLVAGALQSVLSFSAPQVAFSATTVNFAFQWKDYGNAPHPLLSDNVLFFDQNNGGTTGVPFAGPLATNGSGAVQLVTNYTNADALGNIWIQPGLVAQIAGVGTGYTNNAAANPFIYFPAGTGGAYGASINQTTSYTNISFISNTDAYRALTVLQYVKFMHDVYADTSSYNSTLPVIRLNYNSGNAGSSMGGGTMTLGGLDWGNVDVIFHEYGHHVAENNSLEGTTLGLGHAMNKDNISANNSGNNYGALNGSKLAWQEGIATYLGMVAVNDGNLAGKIPGLPADATNMIYDQFQPPAVNQTINPATDLSWNVAINSLAIQVGPHVEPDPEGDFGPPTGGNVPFNSRGAGEGDEMSVMRTMWDFENNANVENYARAGQTDYSNFGGKKMYDLMKSTGGANKGTFYAFWQTITTDVRTPASKPLVALAETDPDAEAVARLGMTLEQNAISSIPLTTGNVLTLPTLTWTEQNNQDSSKFMVLIYSADWTTLIQQSPQIAAGVDSWTLTTPLANGQYEYVVLNSPALATNADLTGSLYNWYWSGDAVIAVPEPGSLILFVAAGGLLLRRRR